MRTLKYLALVLWLTATAHAAEVPSDKTAGVGVVLGVDGQHIVVRRILPDSPAAAQKSIHVGDKILAVAQEREAPVQLQGVKLAQAVPLLRGAFGTTVRLTIVPAGEDDSQARVVSFVRGELKAVAGWGDGVLLTNGMKAPDIEMVWLLNGRHWNGKVVLIAANVEDSADAATTDLKRNGWNETHNVWVGADAIKAYHVDAIPTAYVIDRHGRIVAANPVNLPEIVKGQLERPAPEGKSQ
ncbi:MAG: hypothetical protein DME22_17265 [Verrucomicrobia bacterium]|nr:MAG: hypothetical protein DME22_17265 [Verrucomicrobiota bacterium]